MALYLPTHVAGYNDRSRTTVLIKLMGHGGVGKLTIARALAPIVSGRVIDNHTVYNPAFAVTEFRSQDFYDMVRCVRDLVLKQAALIPVIYPSFLRSLLDLTLRGMRNGTMHLESLRPSGGNLFYQLP